MQNNFFQLHTGDFRQCMIRTPYKIPKICVQVALLFGWWNVIAALNKKNKKWGNYMYIVSYRFSLFNMARHN